jgi:3-isopropylmalate/(R)-2-methylmalate dehydratase small subunit
MSKVTQVRGRAVPVRGDDIDTDRIIPARYLKEITFSKMGDYPFFDERFNADGSPKPHPFNEARFQGATVLIGNVNFGCGSSREHAPQSLVRWGNPAQPGIKAIIAESFAEIFAGNCVMLGVPAVTAAKDDVLALQGLAERDPQTEFTVDLESLTVKAGALTVKVALAESRRDALLKGTWDGTGLLIANADKVAENAKKLAYMNGYR